MNFRVQPGRGLSGARSKASTVEAKAAASYPGLGLRDAISGVTQCIRVSTLLGNPNKAASRATANFQSVHTDLNYFNLVQDVTGAHVGADRDGEPLLGST